MHDAASGLVMHTESQVLTWTPAFRKLKSQLVNTLAFLPAMMPTNVDLNTPFPEPKQHYSAHASILGLASRNAVGTKLQLHRELTSA